MLPMFEPARAFSASEIQDFLHIVGTRDRLQPERGTGLRHHEA